MASRDLGYGLCGSGCGRWADFTVHGAPRCNWCWAAGAVDQSLAERKAAANKGTPIVTLPHEKEAR